MNKIIFAIILLLTLIVLVVNGPERKYAFDYPVAEEVHYHAGFLVVKDGVLQDYSGLEFMKVNPCGIDMHDPDIEVTAQEEQLEKAHLHDENGDVVHVHRENATWRDLFVNINVEISDDSYAYKNEEKIDGFLNKVIEPNESLVIIDGAEPSNIDEIIENKVTLERIQEVEQISESCSS